MKIWYYAFVSLMIPVLMNLLIGVLSENFGTYEAMADSLLNRARAQGLLRLEMCLWHGRPRSSCLSCLDGLFWLDTPTCKEVTAAPPSPSSASPCCPFLRHQQPEGEALTSYAELGSCRIERFLWASFSELPDSQPSDDLTVVKEFIDKKFSSLDIDAKLSNLDAKIADLSKVVRLS